MYLQRRRLLYGVGGDLKGNGVSPLNDEGLSPCMCSVMG